MVILVGLSSYAPKKLGIYKNYLHKNHVNVIQLKF